MGMTDSDAFSETVGATEAEPAATSRRLWCHRCVRAQSTCICSALPTGPLPAFDTRTRIVLLVHPKEEIRKLGTAPLLRLCLRNLLYRVDDRFPAPDEDPKLHADLVADGRRCVLVCPGPDAEELRPALVSGDASEASCALDQPVDLTDPTLPPPTTLIFIDGRWPQAKSMVNRSKWLQELPRAVLCPTEQSGYVFRKQPAQGCLSTLEAVAEALLALEGARGPALKAALVAPFQLMVEHQKPYMPEVTDKNAFQARPEWRPDAEDVRLFDAKAAMEKLGGTPAVVAPWEVEKPQDEPVHPADRIDGHCVVRWGARALGGREMVVVQVLRATYEGARHRAKELSIGQPHGKRCWVLPIGKVQEGARFEEIIPAMGNWRCLAGRLIYSRPKTVAGLQRSSDSGDAT